jgi:hypothetical protein
MKHLVDMNATLGLDGVINFGLALMAIGACLSFTGLVIAAIALMYHPVQP